MTGGAALVLDEHRQFPSLANDALIAWRALDDADCAEYVRYLRKLLMEHRGETGSRCAEGLLADLEQWLPRFWLVTPKDAQIAAVLERLHEAA